MACPYFYPVEARATEAPPCSRWATGGRASATQCPTLPPPRPEPRDTVCDTLCNLGYARGDCARFPAGDGPDAARFTISGDHGAVVRISMSWSATTIRLPTARWSIPPPLPIFATPPEGDAGAPGAAYVESYLRRKSSESDMMEGKPVRESISEYSDWRLPNDANGFGNVLGGKVMHLVDLAAAMAAMRHARNPVVTASVDSLHFLHPVHICELIDAALVGESGISHVHGGRRQSDDGKPA